MFATQKERNDETIALSENISDPGNSASEI